MNVGPSKRDSAKTIADVVIETLQQLREQGFARGTLQQYRLQWEKFAFFAYARGKRCISAPLVQEYVRAMMHRNAPAIIGPSTTKGLRRSMRVLQEHAINGKHARQPFRSRHKKLPMFMERAIARFSAHIRTVNHLSDSTIRGRVRTVRRFFEFLHKKRFTDWRSLAPAHVMSYVERLGHLAVNTRRSAVDSLRLLFRVLFVLGVLRKPLHYSIPSIRQQRGALATIWTPDEIRATLAAIDRQTATGKRNYAIILLAARLGLRVSDILGLRLENIDWARTRISIEQVKTKRAVELPMTAEIGNALADYLRHARPATPLRQVFLRRLAPLAPLGRKNNMHGILNEYRAKAGLPTRTHCGLHSLRHTLATNLLSTGERVETIRSVLGHSSLDTTSLYLRFDVENLRMVGLNPDEEVRYA
jgi:site-specific recombinase XerD